ncbi:MAG: hypothetical protein IJ125_00575 [Atopobiaceae bacterium]|nr:hypothetical protein [Atopobiaceae bacterium]
MSADELVIPRESLQIASVDRREVLRYLGHREQELTSEFEALLDETIARCLNVATPRMALRSFALANTESAAAVNDAAYGTTATAGEPAALRLVGSQLELVGCDIAKHLAGADRVVLMAVTTGNAIDQELRRLSFGNSLEQLVFDAAATALVERVADVAEARVRDWAASMQRFTSWRFSPGYGDLPLETQRLLLASLDATRQLGITLTDSLLMAPTKSVSAIMGVHAVPQSGMASSCSICSLFEFCTQRLQGRTCCG